MKTLPGAKVDSTIQKIYQDLLDGKTLTSLSAIFDYRTVCLTKYISDLRLKYAVNVRDKWIETESGKRCKQYFLLSK